METGVSAQKKPTWLARLLINRRFALLWSGQSISYLGDYVFDTTLLLWIAASIARGQSWGPLAVSGLLAATALPALWGMRFASVDTLLLGAGVLVVLGGLYAMVNLRHLPPARQDVDQPAKPAEVVGAASSD